jgi:3-hydroxyanthranilate 3,4-dioxygenase
MNSNNIDADTKIVTDIDTRPTPAPAPGTGSINASIYPAPLHLQEWISANKSALKPPVGNKLVYDDASCQFKVMIVGGPNTRTDYHINQGEEWFYQLKGDMVLKIVDDGQFKDVVIRQGECYLHPGGVPHSPQRFKDSIGLVIERIRYANEKDGLRWYCREAGCGAVLHQVFFHCTDLGAQLKPVIQQYYADETLRTCNECKHVDQPPTQEWARTSLESKAASASSSSAAAPQTPKVNPDTHPMPFSFQGWIDQYQHLLQPPVGNKLMSHKDTEFNVMIVGGPNTRSDYHIEDGEEWFYMVKGDMILKVVDNGTFRDIPIKQGESFLLPANVPHSPQRFKDTIGLVLERRRSSDELDGLRWYCSNVECREILYEEFFHCTDLGTQLKPVIEKYYADESIELRTCKKCGLVDTVPQ